MATPNVTYDDMGAGSPEEIVQAIAASRAKARLRFRTLFVLTWLILVGGLVLAILSTGRIDGAFLQRLGAVHPGAASRSRSSCRCVSITFATVFAIIGALGRLSRTRPDLRHRDALRLARPGHAADRADLLHLLGAARVRHRPAGRSSPGVFALAFNYGAYMTEIFRAGIQAVPRGQVEAAAALGMTERSTMRRIVLPQAIRIVIPAIGNDFIAMIKDSALVSFVALQETLLAGADRGSANFQSFATLHARRAHLLGADDRVLAVPGAAGEAHGRERRCASDRDRGPRPVRRARAR